MSAARFIGIVCGLKSEAGVAAPFAARGNLRIAISGANAARAENLALEFCNGGAAAILSVGVSGGLDPRLQPGALVLAHAVVTRDARIEFEPLIAGPGVPAEAQAAGLGAPVFGSDTIIDTSDRKAALFAATGAVAVDMESHGAARAAKAAGVPFLAIRAIADPASRALPKAALGAVAPDGSTRVLRTLLESAKAPGDFPALLQLGADSTAALKTLRVHLGPLLDRLFLRLDL